MTRRFPLLFPLLVCWTVSAAQAQAQSASGPVETPPESGPAPRPAVRAPNEAPPEDMRNPNTLQRLWSWSDARVRGVFDYVLPDTQERRTWKLSLQPRLGDFVRRDHVRLPVALAYGLNRRTEAEIGIDPYFANPFKDGEGAGVANINGTFKYQWVPALDDKIRAVSGVGFEHPFSSAPYKINEGVNRYRVYTTFARTSPWNPNLDAFFSMSYDLITPSAAVGEIDDDEPQNDFYKFGTGILYRHKRFTYGLALSYAHTTDGVGTSFTTVTPSVIFDVPKRYTFNSPGQWQLGTSVEAKHYGNETAFDLKVRVRWQVDFRRVMKDWREARVGGN